MVQHITLAGVKAACRKAYKKGTLLAQNETKDDKCVYFNGEYACAIGVALEPEIQIAIHQSDSNEKGIDACADFRINGYFWWDADEHVAILSIQKAHDLWKIRRYRKDLYYKEEFCSLIGVKYEH